VQNKNKNNSLNVFLVGFYENFDAKTAGKRESFRKSNEGREIQSSSGAFICDNRLCVHQL
jgi:hypothetical protein